MRRLCMCMLAGLFALSLASGMAAAQDTQWVKDKNTGEWVKVKKSGDKWKVKKSGKKYKIKESSSGAKVKSSGAKVRFDKPRQGQTSTIDKVEGSKVKPVEPSGEREEKKTAPAIESGVSSREAASPDDDVISSVGE